MSGSLYASSSALRELKNPVNLSRAYQENKEKAYQENKERLQEQLSWSSSNNSSAPSTISHLKGHLDGRSSGSSRCQLHGPSAFYNRMFEELHNPENIPKKTINDRAFEEKKEKQSKILDEFNCYLSQKVEEKETGNIKQSSNPKTKKNKEENRIRSPEKLEKNNQKEKIARENPKKEGKFDETGKISQKSQESKESSKFFEIPIHGFNSPEVSISDSQISHCELNGSRSTLCPKTSKGQSRTWSNGANISTTSTRSCET